MMRLRPLISFAALLVATVICVEQRHVRIVLAEPSTYSSPIHHRCGLLLLGCLGWVIVEVTLLARPSSNSRTA